MADTRAPQPGQWPVDPQEPQKIEETRLWIDGCFDFFHHGHTNVMLQSRRLGEELWVGLHSDEDIASNKGPTVMNLAERTAAIDACRFVTQVVPHAPYVTDLAWVDHYGCAYVTHGDDITSDASGEDCYRYVKKAGRMKIVKRTEGISTTDLVGRMLGGGREHFVKDLEAVLEGKEGGGREEVRKMYGGEMRRRMAEYGAAPNGLDKFVDVYSFRPRHTPFEKKERRRSRVKSNASSEASASQSPPSRGHHHHDPGKGKFNTLVQGIGPQPDQRIVYVDGGFDLFSSGHIAFLESVSQIEHDLGEKRGWFTPQATEQRTKATGHDYPPAYVIAGIHDDEVINYWRGENYPIMNILERGLCVIQCKYIHCVVFSAPITPSKHFLSHLPPLTTTSTDKSNTRLPDAVYHGPTSSLPTPQDPFADAKALEIFAQAPEHRFQDVNAAQIVSRILDKREEYEERQRKKGAKAVGEEEARRGELERERTRDSKDAERRKPERKQSDMKELERKWSEVERAYGA